MIRSTLKITTKRSRIVIGIDGSILRSFSTILIDADNAETFEQVEFFLNELFDHAKSYPIVQLEFAKEHFMMLMNKFKR